jgi:hypothetical protein
MTTGTLPSGPVCSGFNPANPINIVSFAASANPARSIVRKIRV